MKFNSDEIASVIQAEIQNFGSQVDVREVGTVLEVGDGIARVYGLSNVMAGEMVEFPSGVTGWHSISKRSRSGLLFSAIICRLKKGTKFVRSANSCRFHPAMPYAVAFSIHSAIRSTVKARLPLRQLVRWN